LQFEEGTEQAIPEIQEVPEVRKVKIRKIPQKMEE